MTAIPNDKPLPRLTDADFLSARFEVGYAVGEHAAWFARCHPGMPAPTFRKRTKGQHDTESLYAAESLGFHLGLADGRAIIAAGGAV